jgi:seryl-tRNA synthetase
MLDIKFIRDHRDLIKDNCQKRRVNVDVDKLLTVEENRRAARIT